MTEHLDNIERRVICEAAYREGHRDGYDSYNHDGHNAKDADVDWKDSDTNRALNANEREAPKCEWNQTDPDGSCMDADWKSECGEIHFDFMEDGPTANKFKFCPGCGKPLVEIPFQPEAPDA